MSAPRSRLWATAAYAAMILAAVGLFYVIRDTGTQLTAPAPVATAATDAQPATGPAANPLFHLLLALAAVVVAGRLLGRLMTWIGQPPVIGEVLAGICLGPSLLGRM